MNDRITSPSDERSVEERAREQVEELKGFYVHLGVFLVIQLMLLAINLLVSPGYLWMIWPFMGWGIGLASHAVAVFGLFGIGGRKWEERKMREYMIRMGVGVREEEIRQMLDQEIDSRTGREQGDISLQRLVQRIENLETIVTSRDWDLMEAGYQRTQTAQASLEVPEEEQEDLPKRAARLSRRVR